MGRTLQIAVAAERSSAYGRNFIKGVAEVAELHAEWALTLVDPKSIAAKASCDYDGWICRVTNARTAKALAERGCPVVDCLCARTEPSFATVKTDADAIGSLAADHLIKHRFSNFAFCGYRRVAFSDRRRNAFASHLETKGIRPAIYRPPMRPENRFGEDFLLGDHLGSPPDAADLANWLKRLPKPVGIFCCDDLRASQVLSICRALKLAVPSDVAILGVDDDPIYCMFSTPRLSSIDPDSVAIGRAAANALAQIFASGTDSAPPPSIAIKPKGVVERESTSTYPHAPTWFADALAFIRSESTKGISASDVFRHVGYSRTLVERTFKSTLATSVQKQIAQVRINEAKRLLSSTSLPIKEIAARTGFSTLEYLSRSFAAATGLTPSAWRENAPPGDAQNAVSRTTTDDASLWGSHQARGLNRCSPAIVPASVL